VQEYDEIVYTDDIQTSKAWLLPLI